MLPVKTYKPISLRGVKTFPLRKRRSKVSLSMLGRPHEKGDTLNGFLDKLPGVFAVKDFRAVVKAIVGARKNRRPVILGMGAHPIKVGLSPIIIDLMRQGIVTALATNGASIVHDFELSYLGMTSEDVESELRVGTFGMARETGKFLNAAISEGKRGGRGIGESVGKMIHQSAFPFREKSIFAAAFAFGVPATVHVAIGTDIIHMHPNADGAAIGEGSFRDFRLFTSVVADLEGGVYINLGSAVIMPEVFLKALAIARNLGNKVDRITTVNMDCVHHYRPRENVLRRPTLSGGACYALTGHHEIMLPLLAAAVIEASAL